MVGDVDHRPPFRTVSVDLRIIDRRDSGPTGHRHRPHRRLRGQDRWENHHRRIQQPSSRHWRGFRSRCVRPKFQPDLGQHLPRHQRFHHYRGIEFGQWRQGGSRGHHPRRRIHGSVEPSQRHAFHHERDLHQHRQHLDGPARQWRGLCHRRCQPLGSEGRHQHLHRERFHRLEQRHDPRCSQ